MARIPGFFDFTGPAGARGLHGLAQYRRRRAGARQRRCGWHCSCTRILQARRRLHPAAGRLFSIENRRFPGIWGSSRSSSAWVPWALMRPRSRMTILSAFKHGADSLGDHQAGMPERPSIQGILDSGFRGHVNGAGAVVQDQDPRLHEQRPGDGDPLFLAAGEVGPPLFDRGRRTLLGQAARIKSWAWAARAAAMISASPAWGAP